jgi:anhydro-N-acetylmuramic acid kinase
MFKEDYHVLGIMSGTSLDGIDIAELFFSWQNGRWQFRFGATHTYDFPLDLLEKLRICVGFQPADCLTLDHEFSFFSAKCIEQFLSDNKISRLDAICMHGHTVKHEPHNRFTLQIGFQESYYEFLKVPLVVDFRTQDVQMGGQGAPLVPIGDALLFADYDYCLNLGGFSNVSFEKNGKRIAFDISPVNTVLNFYANQLGLDFDDQGEIARTGKLHQHLLNELNGLNYYKKSYPKSLGFEFVKEIILPLLEKYDVAIEDKMHTFVEHIAIQTGSALPNKEGKILITGGGAYHEYLIERLMTHLPKMKIIIPDTKTLEYK